MGTKKDYYEILGIKRDVSLKEIKAAYRKLARKFHPDVNKQDKGAEERFKEVSEAFAVLSDPDKRAKYDRGGHEAFGPGFDPFAGFDLGDLGFGNLSDLFGMFTGRGRGPSRPRKGSDLRMELRVAFLDAVQGKTLEISIPRKAVCSACGGQGHAAAGGGSACPDCGGSGHQRQVRGGLHMSMACQRCGGSGRAPGPACGACGGSGRTAREEQVKVRIPAGVDDASTVRLAGRGDAGTGGAPAGDLFLVLRVEPHATFRRDGRDLLCDVPLGLARAALGGNVEVPTLNGGTTIHVPGGTRSGQKFRLRGKGVPGSQRQPAGDLYAVIQIHPPRQLDARSKELLEEFEELNPDPT